MNYSNIQTFILINKSYASVCTSHFHIFFHFLDFTFYFNSISALKYAVLPVSNQKLFGLGFLPCCLNSITAVAIGWMYRVPIESRGRWFLSSFTRSWRPVNSWFQVTNVPQSTDLRDTHPAPLIGRSLF